MVEGQPRKEGGLLDAHQQVSRLAKVACAGCVGPQFTLQLHVVQKLESPPTPPQMPRNNLASPPSKSADTTTEAAQDFLGDGLNHLQQEGKELRHREPSMSKFNEWSKCYIAGFQLLPLTLTADATLQTIRRLSAFLPTGQPRVWPACHPCPQIHISI